MKRLIIIGMGLMLLSLVSCNVSVGKSFKFSNYDEFVNEKEMYEDKENILIIDRFEEIDKSDVEKIMLKASFEEVEIIEEERENIKIHHYGIYDTKSKGPEYDINKTSTFSFEVDWKNFIGSSNSKVVIYIPKDYNKTLEVDITSGDIKANELHIENVYLSATSGAINIKTLEADEILLENTSGEMEINTIRGEYIKLLNTSGSQMLKSVESITFDSSNKSGGIIIDYINSEEIDINTTSGGVKLKMSEQNGDVNITTTSGSVEVNVEGNLNAEVELKASSGSVNYTKDLQVVTMENENRVKGFAAEGKYTFKVTTTSGDITIK